MVRFFSSEFSMWFIIIFTTLLKINTKQYNQLTFQKLNINKLSPSGKKETFRAQQ